MNLKLSSKEKYLIDSLLDDDYGDDKIIIFTQFTKNFKRFAQLMFENGLLKKTLFLSGDNVSDIEEIKQKFQSNDYQYLFMSPTAQYGVDGLEIANRLIMFDIVYNPSVYKQTVGRLNRLSSEHSTIFVTNLILNNTIDNKIMKLLNDKENLASMSIDGIESYIFKQVWK